VSQNQCTVLGLQCARGFSSQPDPGCRRARPGRGAPNHVFALELSLSLNLLYLMVDVFYWTKYVLLLHLTFDLERELYEILVFSKVIQCRLT
jgi:hypothetical protein